LKIIPFIKGISKRGGEMRKKEREIERKGTSLGIKGNGY